MFSRALERYLASLDDRPQTTSSISLDRHGRAHGRFFNVTLSSAFQAIQALGSGRVIGFEGFAHSYSESDLGLSLWRLLDHAASDDESIALDRLCRVLHAINYYRQAPASNHDLFLSVHARLLSAVDKQHGAAFRRVLDALELRHQSVVLQLPLVTKNQNWPLNFVAENYRRHGFRLAVNAADTRQALDLLELVRPDVIKLDARKQSDFGDCLELLTTAAARGVRLIFKRVETQAGHDALLNLGALSGQEIVAQGFLWGAPAAELEANPPATLAHPSSISEARRSA